MKELYSHFEYVIRGLNSFPWQGTIQTQSAKATAGVYREFRARLHPIGLTKISGGDIGVGVENTNPDGPMTSTE